VPFDSFGDGNWLLLFRCQLIIGKIGRPTIRYVIFTFFFLQSSSSSDDHAILIHVHPPPPQETLCTTSFAIIPYRGGVVPNLIETSLEESLPANCNLRSVQRFPREFPGWGSIRRRNVGIESFSCNSWTESRALRQKVLHILLVERLQVSSENS
jgi:hypothetical protein